MPSVQSGSRGGGTAARHRLRAGSRAQRGSLEMGLLPIQTTCCVRLPSQFKPRAQGRCYRLLGIIAYIILKSCFHIYLVLNEMLLYCLPQHLRPGLSALYSLRFARAHCRKPGKQHRKGPCNPYCCMREGEEGFSFSFFLSSFSVPLPPFQNQTFFFPPTRLENSSRRCSDSLSAMGRWGGGTAGIAHPRKIVGFRVFPFASPNERACFSKVFVQRPFPPGFKLLSALTFHKMPVD